MASYPRSGNTLLRSYIEKVMGLCTGSDTDITHLLNKALMTAGLAGEGLVDKRVWVIKSHFPERYGGTRFGTERCILLVRNPLDCIISFFNMMCSKSHNLTLAEDTWTNFSNVWDDYVRTEIQVWRDFHNWWLTSKVPVHIIRFEDITMKPQETITSLMKYILNVETLKDTCIEGYISLACK